MKKISTIFLALTLLMFYACHKEENHPYACFAVDNPIMSLGDTVRIKYCSNAKISRDTKWDMGDGTTNGFSSAIPKYVYKAKGTYTIKLTSYEHLEGMTLHFQKKAVSETQQIVTVQ
jgi:hypothetical protein